MRALKRSPRRPRSCARPGNAGIPRDAPLLDAALADVEGLARAPRPSTSSWSAPRRRWSPALADALAAEGVRCFGPSAAAARLEGSKAFAKEVMAAAGVPDGRPRGGHDRRGRAGRDRRATRP